MRRLALTTWSLHPNLQPADGSQPELTLLDVPRRMREAGIGTLEICHFHLPSTDPDYLQQLRAAIQDADVELFSILIDTGDPSSADPEQRAADLQLIRDWIEVAATLGAKVARVVAGQSPPNDAEALNRSIAALRELSAFGRERGVRVLTENFLATASTPENCLRIVDELEGDVGLCADIGNFPAASRVADFTAVVGRAESVHAKASYDEGGNLLPDQLRQCLDATLASGFDGPYTLVYDRPAERWSGIARLKEVVAPYAA